ncbi:MAG: FtsW/RodA/SpoVE family cell cycle protein [Oscillospiraceae bacterium]
MLNKLRGILSEFVAQADLVLLCLCVGASCFGLLLITSATRYTGSYRNVIVQGVALCLGIVCYVLFSLLDVEAISRYWKWLLLGSVALILLLLTPLGVERYGNRAWLYASWFPVQVQPAEVVKLPFAILLAKQLALLREEGDLRSVRSAAFVGGHVLFMVGLIFVVSGDAGSCLVYVFMFACMAFAAGFALRWFAAVGAVMVGAFSFLWYTDKLPGYMKERFMVVFDHSYDPGGVGWNQTRSLLALGSGRVFGQGLFHGTQTQSASSASLPNRENDFIFSVAGEELGMVGCLLVLALLALIILRCLYVARGARSPMEQYVCVGIAGMLIFQTVENVGMCLFLMPVIGLTLPFFSYGGSSILMLFCAMGVVSGIKKRSRPDWLR